MNDNPSSDLNPQDKSKQKLIDTLLEQHYADNEWENTQNERRYNDVMKALSNKQNNPKSINRTWFALAASICLVILTVSIVILPSKNALAEIHQMLIRLNTMADRVYSISIAPINKEKESQVQSEPNIQKRRLQGTEVLNNALLYMRDAQQYVLQTPVKNSFVVRGRNEQKNWKIDTQGSLQYYSNYNSIKLPFANNVTNLAFLDLSQLLQLLESDYTLSIKKNAGESLFAEQSLWLLTADKKSKLTKGSPKIKLYYNPQNYLIENMEFTGVHLQGDKQRYKLKLTLINREPLAHDFFDPNYHFE